MPHAAPKRLSALEQLVMDHLWAHGPATSEQVRLALEARHPMKDATVRTILRRLEEKGYATHREEGRAYVYSGLERAESAALRSIRQLIDRFFGGSAEALVTGLVEDEVLDPAELQALARRLEKSKDTRS